MAIATRASKAVDEYIAAQEPGVQRALKRVRATIRRALPNAEEVISYKVPAYRLNGRSVIYIAGWEKHIALYPANDRVVAAFDGELDQYRSGKGTLRFPLSEPLPTKLIERVVKYRAGELAGKG
jgi:uncharacterized protein YdhG (YjbR/CyaY superfamily)